MLINQVGGVQPPQRQRDFDPQDFNDPRGLPLMSRVTVEPRMAATIKRLKKLEGKIKNPAPILEEVGDLLRKTTVSRFFAQTGPTGKPVEAVEGGEAEAAVDAGPHR